MTFLGKVLAWSCFCWNARRALQTAELAFQGLECDRIVSHWATERLYHASDVRENPERLLTLTRA